MRSYRNEFSEWNRIMDSLFTDLLSTSVPTLFEPIKKLPSVIASSQWPPFDSYVDEDKSYNVEVAVAGYKSDQVSVDFRDDNLVVTFKDEAVPVEAEKAEGVTDVVAKMDDEKKDGKRYIHKGIKRPGSATVSYFVDPQYFDKNKIEAELKDGVLHVKVAALPEPAKDEKKIKIAVR